jgi:hypothetical protein
VRESEGKKLQGEREREREREERGERAHTITNTYMCVYIDHQSWRRTYFLNVF